MFFFILKNTHLYNVYLLWEEFVYWYEKVSNFAKTLKYNSNNLYFTRPDNERRACFKYNIPLSTYRAILSLPPELDTDLVPNLGSKVNHHFQFNNSAFGEIEHPRWGVIVGVGTTKPIKARNLL